MHKNNAVNLNIIKIMMRQRSFVFLVVLFLLFSGEISGQNGGQGWRFPVNYRSLVNIDVGSSINGKGPVSGYGIEEKNRQTKTLSLRVRPAYSFAGRVIAPSYYCNNLGYFCKKELQIQKLVSLPVYIRLGSLQYVNYLEQKPNAVRPVF
jgi:hypothetical protein